MNRVLITGDKGFVGSNIRAALEPDQLRLGETPFVTHYHDWVDPGRKFE